MLSTSDHDILDALALLAGDELHRLQPPGPTQDVPIELLQGLVAGEVGLAQEPGHREPIAASLAPQLGGTLSNAVPPDAR